MAKLVLRYSHLTIMVAKTELNTTLQDATVGFIEILLTHSKNGQTVL